MWATGALFFIALASLVCSVAADRSRLRIPIGISSLLGAAVSMTLEGLRWPLVPLWICCLWLGWGLLRVPGPVTAVGIGRRSGFQAVITGLFLYCALNLAQTRTPRLELPLLSGPHPVAKHQWTVVADRPDPHNPDPFAKREFLISVYYPTQMSESLVQAPYLSAAAMDARFFQHQLPLTRFFFKREVLMLRARALEGEFREGEGAGLSPALAKYPVIIFSPGRTWFADLHTFYLEQLASHGYVVFAITHPGGSTALVEYPDGRRRRGGWSSQYREEEGAVVRRRKARLKDMRSKIQEDLGRHRLPSESTLRTYASLESTGQVSRLLVRKQDVVDLLDRLQGLNMGNPPSEFAGRLDLQNIAITGMSYGGPTASEVCLDDVRCKVVVNLDGEEVGRLPIESGVRPALWLYNPDRWGKDWNWQGDFRRPVAYERYAGPAYRVGFDGAKHTAFADFPFWPREIGWLDILLPRWIWENEAHEVQASLPEVILDYELDFLDHYLKGKELRLVNGGAPREGVSVDSRNTVSQRD